MTIASATTSVCQTSGTLVTLRGVGTCSITASQTGNSTYTAALAVSQSFTVSKATPSGSFTVSTLPQGGSSSISVAMGDFNGDGKQDLAVGNIGNNTVTILLGDGAGNFTPTGAAPIDTGAGPFSLVVGDFNADGKLDLAMTDFASPAITVLLGDGAGGFNLAPGNHKTVGAQPYSLVVGDFNGDGLQDLAVANEVGNSVTILLGTGSGSFIEAPSSPIAVGASPTSLAVGDFNRDGIEDLVVADAGGTGDVRVLLGNGSGTFTTSSILTPVSGAFSVAVGDVNGDGNHDLCRPELSGDR